MHIIDPMSFVQLLDNKNYAMLSISEQKRK